MAAFDDEVQPSTLSVITENLPPELLELPQWVLWEWVKRGDKWTKPPINAKTFGKARSNGPATWSPFEKVRPAYEAGAYPGAGFVLTAEDDFCFIDLDHCRYTAQGIIAPWAISIIERFPGTYIESSPSGHGIKILIRGRIPGSKHTKAVGGPGAGAGAKVEFFDRLKYTTLTGNLVDGGSREIVDHQDALDAFYGELFGEEDVDPFPQFQTRTVVPEPLSDDDEVVLAKARASRKGDRIVRLIDQGDISAYGNDRSRADQAACNDLAFWFQKDPARMDRVFRRTPLYRPKWDEVHSGDGATYGAMTISTAIAGCADVYTPAAPRPRLRALPTTTANTLASDDAAESELPPVGSRIEAEIPTPPTGAERVDIGDGQAVYLSAQDQHTKEVTRQAWAAIIARNDPPSLFMYANQPTRLVFDVDGTPIPEPLDEGKLSHRVARDIIWYRSVAIPKSNPVEYEHRYAHPPAAIVKDMLEEPGVDLPVLRRITQSPAFAADGSLSLTPGYHPPSRSYYAANGLEVPAIPDDPTEEEIEAARWLIADEVFGDFPFVDDADRAHAFAMLLQPFVRASIDNTTPLYMINKPKAGTGATLLAQAVSLITTGQPSPTMTQGRSEDEWRKRLTSTLLPLPAQVLIDNVRGTLDDPAFASVLTARVWADRILGVSKNAKIPVSCTWVATGNNVGMSDEIARRSVPIRLDAQVERPDARGGWRHDHIEDWVIEHRGELVGACLTICQAWFAAGQPTPATTTRLGGYETWSRVIGGVLEVAGIPGFLGNLKQFRDRADVTTDVTKAFLERWWSDHQTAKVTIKSLVSAATDVGVDLGKSDNERSLTSTLGRFVKRLEGQRYTIDGDQMVQIVDAGKDGHTKAQLWMLEQPIDAELAELAELSHARRGRPSKAPPLTPLRALRGSSEKVPQVPQVPQTSGASDVRLPSLRRQRRLARLPAPWVHPAARQRRPGRAPRRSSHRRRRCRAHGVEVGAARPPRLPRPRVWATVALGRGDQPSLSGWLAGHPDPGQRGMPRGGRLR